MSKKFQLQIPTPCHENWDNMSHVEKGRFCSSCQKQVVDFSEMNDREIAMFFKKPSTGSVCGRFMQDQLDRDFEIPKKRIPWVKYFFQFLLPGFLLSCTGRTMGKVRATESKIETERLLGEVIEQPLIAVQEKPAIVGDTIVLPNADPEIQTIQYPLIQKRLQKRKADKVAPLEHLQETNLAGHDFKAQNLHVIDHSTGLLTQGFTGRLGGVMVVGGIGIKRCKVSKKSKVASIAKKIFAPQSKDKIKVYPNPVKSNATIHIEWKQTENGYHILQLFDLQGQLVFTKEMFIDEEAKLLSVDLPSLAAGSYFLRMTNKKTSKSYSGKILVE